MTAAGAIWASDLRTVVRDRTVGALFAVPIIFLVLLRLGVPALTGRLPAATSYAPVILGLAVTVAAMIPAFMLAFIILDELDEGLTAVFLVLPIAPGRLLSYRLTAVAVFGYLSSFLLILSSGVPRVPADAALILAVPGALEGPAGVLIAIALAKNKIEGLAVFKGLFFVLALGVVGGIPVAPWWIDAFGVIPAYWVFAALAAADFIVRLTAIAIAVLTYAVIIAVAYYCFRRRTY